MWKRRDSRSQITYFEEVSNTEWIEATYDGKLIDRFELIEKTSNNEVILKRIGTTYFMKLSSITARWGTDKYNCRNLVSKGTWLCKDCKLPSKNQNDNYSSNHFNFTVINDLNYEVVLTWIDYNGRTYSSPFVTLETNSSTFQYSYSNHRWVITSDAADHFEFRLAHGYLRESNVQVNISTIQF